MSELAPAEQEKLNDFQVITAFPEEQYDKVVALLKNNYWNLEIALSKYFDGQLEQEAARDLETERAREPTPLPPSPPALRQAPAQHERLADFMEMNMFQHGNQLLLPQLPLVRPITNRWRTQPGLNRPIDHFGLQTLTQNPLLFLILLIPRTLTFLLTGLGYLFNLLFPPSPNLIPPTPTLNNFNSTQFYEKVTQDHSDIEFFKGDFNEAFNQCKQESKFMLLMLVGDNELSTGFIKKVLNNAKVPEIIQEEGILVYMAHVCEPQGLEISRNLRTRAIPAAYLLANVSSGPSGVSSMSICARLPVKTANSFIAKVTSEVERYRPELITKRIEQEELEYARKIREMQDRAYAESLVADKEKKEQKEQEEKVRQEIIDRVNWKKTQRKRFLASLLGKYEGLEELPKGKYTSIRFKLPSGEGITQRFSDNHSLFDVYSFIDLTLHLKDLADEEREELEALKDEICDEKYTHEFMFELTSPFPRYSVPIDHAQKVKETNQLWPNGSVMLEFFEESDEEEDDE